MGLLSGRGACDAVGQCTGHKGPGERRMLRYHQQKAEALLQRPPHPVGAVLNAEALYAEEARVATRRLTA